MTAQLTIWDSVSVPPSHSDPNSRAAAESMIGAAGSIRRAVAARIACLGPLAEHELEAATGWSGNTIRPRIVELSRAGIIRRLEETGVTPSGRKCALYLCTDLGLRLLKETAR
jgi:hypothetical protein